MLSGLFTYISVCCLVLPVLTQCTPPTECDPRSHHTTHPRGFPWLNCPLLNQEVITSSEMFTTGACCKAVAPVFTSPSVTNCVKGQWPVPVESSFKKNWHREGWKRSLAMWQCDFWQNKPESRDTPESERKHRWLLLDPQVQRTQLQITVKEQHVLLPPIVQPCDGHNGKPLELPLFLL